MPVKSTRERAENVPATLADANDNRGHHSQRAPSPAAWRHAGRQTPPPAIDRSTPRGSEPPLRYASRHVQRGSHQLTPKVGRACHAGSSKRLWQLPHTMASGQQPAVQWSNIQWEREAQTGQAGGFELRGGLPRP
jgi:hypothetical protein